MREQFAIGIDLGGTRIKGTVIDTDGNILHRLYTPTFDGDGAVWKHAVANTVHDLLGKINGHDCVIGISAPGLPSHDHTAIAYMPGRMQGLENFLWQGFLQRPTYVLNDAVAALIAETISGAAKNKNHVVMLHWAQALAERS